MARALELLHRLDARPDHVDLVPLPPRQVSGGRAQLRFRQEVAGLPVLRGEHAVFLAADGGPVAARLGVRAAAPPSGAIDLPVEAAVQRAARALGDGALRYRVIRREDAAFILAVPGAGEARAQPVAVVSGRETLVAWRVDLARSRDPEDWWCVLVGGSDGEILDRIPLTRHASIRARVWPGGVLQPSEMVDLVDGQDVLDPASPEGWVEVDATDGPNMTVWEDRAGDGGGTAGVLAYATGDPLAFDFPFTGDPAQDLDAALVNVFWALNTAHDRLWHLGFDEASGNMQRENFGRGGSAGDFTRVFVQYQAGPSATGIRNSNTAYTSTDGNYNSLTFGLWDRSGEIRDGGLDTGLVYHEYAHLLVNRMVGGDNTCDNGIQPSALAEGWADAFAWTMTGDRVLGAYVSGDADVGIRTQPIGAHAYSYANLCNIRGEYRCGATQDGEIWSGFLYDLRQAMEQAHGPEEGADRTDRLIVEGMRYTPCQPTFVDARDGILAAEAALTGGADRCIVWQAAALRGLGWSASSTGPDDQVPWFAFDPAPECAGGASLAWGRARYGDDADARLVLADAGPGTGREIEVATSGGDMETYPASGPGMIRTAVAPLRPGAANAGDGVVQVAEGDTLTARCLDCPGAPEATTTVSRDLAVTVLTYGLSSETCHDDDAEPAIDDFDNEVTGILDAGELANFYPTLGNREPFPLEQVRVRVTADHPGVHVEPRGWIPVGDVRASNRDGWPFQLDLRILGDASLGFGEEAVLTFEVEARGLAGAATLTLPLAADYLDLRGLEAWEGTEDFERSSPTASRWTHAPADGLPADQWDIRDCGDAQGRAMSYTGDACGLYPDTPSAATLISPPLFEATPDVISIHPLQFTWRNQVDLGYDTRTGYCESEMVLLYFTDDPARPRYDEPRTLRFDGAQYWVQWPAFFETRNTSGWITETTRNEIDAGDIRNLDPAEIRLYWIFFTDVYNPDNSGGCRTSDPDAVGGGYRLDDVSFTYDALSLQAPVDSCAEACVVGAHLSMDPAEGARCPGDPVRLTARASASGCPGGVLEYRFRGPGLDSGYQGSTSWDAVPDAGGNYTLNVRCRDLTSCADSDALNEAVLDDSVGGRLARGTLRARRNPADGDLVLDWEGTRAPEAYAVFGGSVALDDPIERAALLADLSLPAPPDERRLADPDQRSWRQPEDPAGRSLHYYRVTGRMPCSGEVSE